MTMLNDQEAEGGIIYRAAFIEAGESSLKEASFASVEDALRTACRDLRAGYAPIGIWGPGRVLVHGAAAIREHCRQRAEGE